MYNNDTIMPGEDAGESFPNASAEISPSANAEQWQEAMNDTEFQGEWGYGEPQAFNLTEVTDTSVPESFEQDLSPNQEVSGASRLTSYGFDTVCRVYNLETVLTKIYNTDVTSGDAVFNPLGKIYEEIEPRPEARAYLFQEIQKDIVANDANNDDPNLNTARSPLGMTPYGEMYDKRLLQDNNQEQTSLDAIYALKHLLDALATEPRFEPLRQRAAAENKSIISLLVGDTINPTITTFLNGVNGELSVDSAEEVLDEIAAEEVNNPDSAEDAADDTAEDVAEDMTDDATDLVLEQFNRDNAGLNTPDATEQNLADRFATPSGNDMFSDADFQNIRADEDRYARLADDFNSDLAARLQSDHSPDFANPAQPTTARTPGEFPAAQ